MSVNHHFKKIINHNNKYFKHENLILKKNKILVEFNGWSIAHITTSYLSKVLSKNLKSQIVAYEGYTGISAPIKLSLYQRAKYFFSKNFFGKYYKVYKSFGVSYFIRPEINFSSNIDLDLKIKKIIDKIKNKEKLLRLKINNILIGDLIYDTYLKIKRTYTVDITDKNFKDFFYESLKIFFFWLNYFKKNTVKAVIIVHTTYLYGIPMRIASEYKIPVYRATFNGIYYIDKKNYHMGMEFNNYPKLFDEFNRNEKIKNLKKSKNIITNKFSKQFKNKKIIKNFVTKSNSRISVLIAMHNFYDSPHVFGDMLFSDFYEWLKFLVKISKKTNYNWYLKLHPENDINDLTFIKKIISKNKNIKIFSPTLGLKNVLEKNIKYVLTCYGTIGYEYAYHGLTVINACKMNPHFKFKFNHNPESISQYSKMILNINKFKINPSKKEILKFFFIRRIFVINNWLELNETRLLSNFRWHSDVYKPSLYSEWVDTWSQKKHERILDTCFNFINSKKPILLNNKKS